MTSIFEELGLSQQDVKKWQDEKKLEHLTDTALCQLYLGVVKGKSFRPPNPIYTVQEMWEKVDKIATGAEDKPNNNRIYMGIKDVNIVAMIKDISYTGCPHCYKSKKTLKKNHCTDHAGGLTSLEELHITEWAIYDGDDLFNIKLFAEISPKYPEHEMVGAYAWVEGYIDLTQDPISLTVNNFRQFTPGKLLGVGSLVEEDEDDIKVDRSKIEFAGFDEEEESEETIFEVDESVNPFAEKKAPRENGLSGQFIEELRIEMTEMLSKWASKTPVPKDSVTRAMKTWVKDSYPEEFEDLDKAEGTLWEVINGLYKDADDDRVIYSGE